MQQGPPTKRRQVVVVVYSCSSNQEISFSGKVHRVRDSHNQAHLAHDTKCSRGLYVCMKGIPTAMVNQNASVVFNLTQLYVWDIPPRYEQIQLKEDKRKIENLLNYVVTYDVDITRIYTPRQCLDRHTSRLSKNPCTACSISLYTFVLVVILFFRFYCYVVILLLQVFSFFFFQSMFTVLATILLSLKAEVTYPGNVPYTQLHRGVDDLPLTNGRGTETRRRQLYCGKRQ